MTDILNIVIKSCVYGAMSIPLASINRFKDSTRSSRISSDGSHSSWDVNRDTITGTTRGKNGTGLGIAVIHLVI